jgi:voltage-gated potassium channel
VRPLSQEGRLFTSFLILFNVGLFAYAISSIVSLFAEGSFTKTIHEFRMTRAIESLNHHTIICGFGRHATEVTQELSKQGMPFVVIESDPDKVEYLREETEYLFISGDATEDDILEEAGIRQAKAIIITLPDDADNLFIVLTSRQMNPAVRIIARANNQIDEIKMRRAGADQTVVPERIGGFYMATLVDKPDLVEFFRLLSNMGPGNVVFEEISVRDLKEQYVATSIVESGLDMLARISLVAVRHKSGQYELNPPKTEVLRPDWHIVLLGNPEQVQEFRSKALRDS